MTPKTFKVTIIVPASDPLCDEVFDTFVYNVPFVEGVNPLEQFFHYANSKIEAVTKKNNKDALVGRTKKIIT